MKRKQRILLGFVRYKDVLQGEGLGRRQTQMTMVGVGGEGRVYV